MVKPSLWIIVVSYCVFREQAEWKAKEAAMKGTVLGNVKENNINILPDFARNWG